MKSLYELNKYRDRSPYVMKFYGSAGDDKSGVFRLASPADGTPILVVASSGDGWDHVSVSTAFRCPTWEEMEYVKRLFFKDDETAMQLHVPPSDHISCHDFCLHLWRPTNVEIPRPPSRFVA